MDYRIILLLTLEGFAGLILLYYSGSISGKRSFCRYMLLLFLALAIRFCFFNDINTDYTWFLKTWVDYYRENGFSGLSRSYGNYNIPYLYFLAFFAHSDLYDFHLIKLLSCLFDILLAYAAMMLIRKCGAGIGRSTIGFFAVLFLPTVILNSAKWGQCDSIYIFFAVLGLELALPSPANCHGLLEEKQPEMGHPLLSMICIAVSFGFKLQAVFIMPVYLVLWSWKKYSWYWFAVFPLTYLILILPAVLLGRPLKDAVFLYIDQANTVGTALNYNSPSFTAFLRNVTNTQNVSFVLILCAIAAMLLLLLLGILFHSRLTSRSFLLYTACMASVIPFLLPHMHDRYFYATDILLVCFAVCCPRMIPAELFAQFGSLICYLAYFPGRYLKVGKIYLTNDWGAAAMLIVILMILFQFVQEIYSFRKNSSPIRLSEKK